MFPDGALVHLDPKTWWYVSRATGFVGWALLAASVLWGLFVTTKTLARSAPPNWVLDLHRHLGGLALAFVVVHLAVLPLDGYTHWGVRDLLVPMASAWHPIPIAFGIVAFYLLLAVELSSLLGRRVPRRWWRRIHVLSFPLYVIASVHLFAAGTDAGNAVARWMVVVVSTLVAFLVVVRVLAAAKPRQERPRVQAVARAARTTAQADAADGRYAGETSAVVT
jgi:DMSO/TMAO reductase YedYZ heme-binding membrane subunit